MQPESDQTDCWFVVTQLQLRQVLGFLDQSNHLEERRRSEVRVHADPVSDQLVGDGLSGRDRQGCMDASEQGVNDLNK